MALEPPPETVHDSADAAYEAIRMWAQERGYGIKKRRTKEDKKGSVRRRDIECDRSGVHNVVNPCRPQTVTRRTDCPFKVKLLRQVDGDNGASWRIVVVNPSHNHDASLDPRVHLCHRKRSRQQLDQIKALTTVGQPGRVILTTLLQENPGTMLVPRDIYNEQRQVEAQRQARDTFMDRWDKLCKAKTPNQYEELWRKLKRDYLDKPKLLGYLETEHYPNRQEVAFAWTSEIRHFGQQVTSQLEGSHADIKKILHRASGDLLDVTTKIRNDIHVKRQDFERAFAAARFYPPADVTAARVPIFTKNFNMLVTAQGLRKVAEQYNKAKADRFDVVKLGDCTGAFTKVFGLPCKHEIARQLSLNKDWKISLEDIDPHWHFVRGESPPPISLPPALEEAVILESALVEPPGRPNKNARMTDTSTRRDPSSLSLLTNLQVVTTAGHRGARTKSMPKPVPLWINTFSGDMA
ncbi:hypothetical protein V8E54_007142 [Elaphomyces granulatus]